MAEIPNILIDYDSQISNYPQAEYFTILQQKNFWFADEVNVEKDIQYVLTELDENSKHGILETLKLFTIYEVKIFDFWSDVVKNMFPDPEIKTMATYFSGIELGIHRIAYNKLNKLLNLYNDEFYNSYKQSKFLVERMNFLDSYIANGTNLEKIAVLCLAEGVVLFSNFAFLMSFRANGFNLLPNVGNVIKFSAKDEDCVDGQTEVLTKTGWVRIDQLQEGVEIAQFHENDRSIDFVVPSKIIKKHYNGTMYEFDKRHFNLLCTEDHQILFYDKDNNPQKRKAKDLKVRNKNKIPTTGCIKTTMNKKFTALDALKVAYCADGHVIQGDNRNGSVVGYQRIKFALKKERKIQRLFELCKLAGLTIDELPGSERSDGLRAFAINFPRGQVHKNLDDNFNIDDVNLEWGVDFLNEITLWDGHVKGNLKLFCTTRENEKDFVQAVASLVGKTTTVIRSADNRKESYKDHYRVSIWDNIQTSSRCEDGVKTHIWNDYVYCVTVPTHNFVMRRNDKVSITGNCHNRASSWLFNTLRKEMSDLNISDNDIENKIYEMSEIIREHEFKIIESIFSRGEIPTIKKEDLENFILSRIDVCMVRMGLKPIHNVKNCKVSSWFDKILGNTQNNDFFAGQGASYSRGFKQDEFKWVKK
jgi:ribonucleotide reductase beta subunit family protein with ferritin-like domain